MKSILSILFLFISINSISQIKKGIYKISDNFDFGGSYVDFYTDSMCYFLTSSCLQTSVSFYKYNIDKTGNIKFTSLKKLDYSFVSNLYWITLDSIMKNEDYNQNHILIKNRVGEFLGEGLDFVIVDNDKVIFETENFKNINIESIDKLNLKIGISTINQFQKAPVYFNIDKPINKEDILIIETTLPERLIFFMHKLRVINEDWLENEPAKFINGVVLINKTKYEYQKN